MTSAYDQVYLEKARVALARMLDFAVHDLHYPLSEFFAMFADSRVGRLFEKGDFTVTVGKSGVELAYLVLELCDRPCRRVKPRFSEGRSPEYWTGWALAYYQWKTGLSYSDIESFAPIDMICEMYIPYHEMDIRQFCDRLDALYKEKNPQTCLKRRREAAGLSQRQLAQLSGVPLRTIQQYEQRQKDINKSQFLQVVRLSRALFCTAEDLLERIE